jgi:hypothetical protein
MYIDVRDGMRISQNVKEIEGLVEDGVLEHEGLT